MARRVLLVEDDLDLANTILQFLDIEGYISDYARNGLTGVNLAQSQNFDVIILDVNLPRLDGLNVCQQLRDKGKTTPILMLTARDSLDDKLAGFKAGTDDYLVKPFALQELAARLNSLANRVSGQSRKLIIDDLILDFDNKIAKRGKSTLNLTPIGWKILEVIARKHPESVSRDTIETQIWLDSPPDTDNLKVHLHKLRSEINKGFEQKLVHTIRGHGYCLQRPIS